MSPKNDDDELIRGLAEAERSRRARALLGGGIVLALLIGAIAVSWIFSDQMFQPKVDISSGEQEVIADTNDPQCRGFIAHVTRIGGDYGELEPKLQDNLLGDDAEQIENLMSELERLIGELNAAEETAAEAALRFDNSRGEVDDWFSYTKNELNLLQKVGAERLADLQPAEEPDAGGTLVEDPAAEKKSKKTPQERLDGATLAANEAFQKFRVWHTGGLHPCGAADEGETPWAPEAE